MKQEPFNTSMPSHIFLGAHDVAKKHVVSVIKGQLCTQDGCGRCTPCQSIDQEQHHAVLWLYPKKNYTLDQFDVVFSRLSFGLHEGERFFIVIQKADFLSQACANSLLKVLEEPSKGYYFFLLVERIDDLLPTIRSRCMIQHVRNGGHSIVQKDVFDFLTTTTGYNPAAFSQQLQQSNINEREAVELVDALLSFWIAQHKQAIIQQKPEMQKQAERVVSILKRASEKFPMPGSGKLFCKNLYVQIKGLQ